MHKASRFFLVLMVMLSTAAHADDRVDLRELLDTNSFAVELSGGRLQGPGADLILKDSANAQFVAIGEEHYNYIIPDITTALFAELQSRYGFHYFMTEQDPVMMEIFSSSPTRGNLEKINSLAQEYPMGVTFNSDEELKMLADIGRMSAANADPIWGCDQASGVTHALDQLLLSVDDPDAVAALQLARAKSQEKEAIRDFSKGNYIFDAPTDQFIELKANINPKKGSHDEWLIDAVINASKVFGFYKNGQNNILPGYYENNRFREEHLKDLCLKKYKAASLIEDLPKVLMKFGSWHLFEGLSPTRMHTIGDFFSGIARFNNRDFLSIYFVSRNPEEEKNLEQNAFIWPFIRGFDKDQFTVVDLRPFRRYPNRNLVAKAEGDDWLNENREDFMRLVYGYDMIFYVGETKSANFSVVPQPD